ncbi:MAG TPA: Crp/Fnr family transcriptional regulator [Bacillota bacterium]|nr:Crp/Fnr family transcriptional regulator [Bacillota bacterium]
MDSNMIMEVINNNNHEFYKIFQNCPEKILSHWETKKYPNGSIICHQGEIFGCFCLIVEGKAAVYILAENGKRYSPTDLGTGDFIGEMEILENKPSLSYVEASTDLKVLQIERVYFVKWLEMDNSLNLYMIKYFYKKFGYCTQKASGNTLYSLKSRLCTYLLSCCEKTSKIVGDIEIKLDKEKLSQELAVTIRSVQRSLQYLSEEKIIEIKPKSIIVKDLKKLAWEEKSSRNE